MSFSSSLPPTLTGSHLQSQPHLISRKLASWSSLSFLMPCATLKAWLSHPCPASSPHFLSSLHQNIYIFFFYLIGPTSAQPAEVITRRTHRTPGCSGWCLGQHSTLGEVICFYWAILNQNVLIFGFDQIHPRSMSWRKAKAIPEPPLTWSSPGNTKAYQ